MISVKVKDSKGTAKQVQMASSGPVVELRKQIFELFQVPSETTIKLIFRGKLLEDAKTLDSYEIKNDSLVMFMVVKKNPEQLQREIDYQEHKAVFAK
jgi:Ubiquitin family